MQIRDRHLPVRQRQLGEPLKRFQMLGVGFPRIRLLLYQVLEPSAEVLRLEHLLHPLPTAHFVEVFLKWGALELCKVGERKRSK